MGNECHIALRLEASISELSNISHCDARIAGLQPGLLKRNSRNILYTSTNSKYTAIRMYRKYMHVCTHVNSRYTAPSVWVILRWPAHPQGFQR